jgi:hypothetical protein
MQVKYFFAFIHLGRVVSGQERAVAKKSDGAMLRAYLPHGFSECFDSSFLAEGPKGEMALGFA